MQLAYDFDIAHTDSDPSTLATIPTAGGDTYVFGPLSPKTDVLSGDSLVLLTAKDSSWASFSDGSTFKFTGSIKVESADISE